MIYVFNIGQYNHDGKFETDAWKKLFFWLSKKIQYINLYSYNEEDVQKILESCQHDSLPMLDDSKSLVGFHLTKLTKTTFDLIQSYSFSINSGIQFLYFGVQNKILMEMQIEDWNNFAFFYLEEHEKLDVLKHIACISANQKAYESFQEDITEMIGERWEPLNESLYDYD